MNQLWYIIWEVFICEELKVIKSTCTMQQTASHEFDDSSKIPMCDLIVPLSLEQDESGNYTFIWWNKGTGYYTQMLTVNVCQ